ncbi:hypothetical protein RIF29_15831 [Crotalaria pallida]|uniref:CI111 double-psi beta barrel domain-containing protein n=1 Tax=Crotalaria pallida TaxID=3830 RepID=A0AAN9IDX3_CROPI
MPSSSSNSKSKKHSKRAQSLTPDPTATPRAASETDDAKQLASLCEEASRKFPLFIGKSAFIDKISDVESSTTNSKGCRVWLSEASMLSSYLSPGSIVSVMFSMFKFEFKAIIYNLAHYIHIITLDYDC